MNLTGYSDRWSVRPGEAISFHVHCTAPCYEAQIVRLRHGDENPRGPGFKELLVKSSIDGVHSGASRIIRKGSYGIVEINRSFDFLTIAVWIWPTTPARGAQGLVSAMGPGGTLSWSLSLDAGGALEWTIGNFGRLTSAYRLDPREWYFIAASFDGSNGLARLSAWRQRFTGAMPEMLAGGLVVSVEEVFAKGSLDTNAILFAVRNLEQTDHGAVPQAVFNGKIAAPRLFARLLAPSECESAKAGLPLAGTLAAWDFSEDPHSTRLIDVGSEGLHGKTCNRPSRFMTGPLWIGEVEDRRHYDGIHFHDDDVSDVDWPESHRLTIPSDWPSGVYGLRLRADSDEDHLPFFVCPPRGEARSEIGFLAPTLSYLIYSNESLDIQPTLQLAPLQNMELRRRAYQYVAENGLMSAYDRHSDGSGVCYASMRRPTIDFRPKARCRTFDAPHQFPADLYLVDWLAEKGIDFDVITDHELHTEGLALLERYRVILTGSHPEYWTTPMIRARDAYLNQGGRLMYLGGNGFYWVTAIADDEPSLAEVRRWNGWRTWQIEPGEIWLSLNSELSGLWRDRGYAPQKSVGVGFVGGGYDRGMPYRRTAESYQPDFKFIFDDVPAEVVGAGDALVLNRGAAGFELDRSDQRLGTPRHAVVLASSVRASDAYQYAVEELLSPTPWDAGRSNPNLRADMVFIEYPKGGAVFSVGSITWTSTLSASGYASDTSRITENVLRAFARGEWALKN
jgi:N,N-dimethylformamidase